MDEKYIRVATTIYKVVEQPLADGTKSYSQNSMEPFCSSSGLWQRAYTSNG